MKKLSLVIAAAMLLSSFAGCGKKEKTTVNTEEIPHVDIENQDEKVDETEKVDEPEDHFTLVSADGNYEYTTTSPEEDVVLKVTLAPMGVEQDA